MRKIFYLLLFLFTFFFFLVATFPVDAVVGHYLNRYNVKYGYISGNLLSFYITDIRYGDFYVERINVSLKAIKLHIKIDNSALIYIYPNREVSVYFKDTDIGKYQTNPLLLGSINGSINLKIENYIKAKGKLTIRIEELKNFGIRNILVNAKLKEFDRGSKVSADIRGNSINGVFKGEILIPSKNILDASINGLFNGTFYGNKVNQKLSLKIKNFVR